MHGNVSEWCEDVWNEEAYGKPSTTATTGPAANLHILRGGEWKFYMILCRSASRYFSSRYHESENIGFRVVQVLDAPVTRLGSADRIAAEWLITKGGDVFITGREDAVTDVNDLPGGDIQVRQVKFRKPPLTGEDRKLLPLRGLQYLEYVSLDTSRVSADGIAVLESLPALRRLGCGSPTFTRENFAAICRLKKLSALYLTGNQLTALDCEALATHIPNLTSLNLCSSPTIDDSAIQTLQGLKNLKSLQLQGTSVTAEGVAALKRTLPDCVVEWDGQADDASK